VVELYRAVIEYISDKVGAKTLFATHYHELTELEGKVKGVKNYHVSVEEIDGKVVFTHKVLPGASEKSYGIHVAELAGLPAEVIERAKEILSTLELPLLKVAEKREVRYEEKKEELPSGVKELIEELQKIEISTTTPLEALLILSRLKERVKDIKLST